MSNMEKYLQVINNKTVFMRSKTIQEEFLTELGTVVLKKETDSDESQQYPSIDKDTTAPANKSQERLPSGSTNAVSAGPNTPQSSQFTTYDKPAVSTTKDTAIDNAFNAVAAAPKPSTPVIPTPPVKPATSSTATTVASVAKPVSVANKPVSTVNKPISQQSTNTPAVKPVSKTYSSVQPVSLNSNDAGKTLPVGSDSYFAQRILASKNSSAAEKANAAKFLKK